MELEMPVVERLAVERKKGGGNWSRKEAPGYEKALGKRGVPSNGSEAGGYSDTRLTCSRRKRKANT